LGGRLLRAHLFAVVFLIFLVPLPTAWENAIEIFFQYTSAEAAALLFAVTGSSVFRDGLVFQLPGITIQVAQECSGIRSSLVLFITSLVAGHMFLQSPWRRAALTLVVIPLAIVRNGFRIYTIGWLCVHVSPTMIDSAIHRHGGPLFFALSLIPFFLLLLWLRWSERRLRSSTPTRVPSAQATESAPRD
jgi:exosortase C (VPDSG-CTERM-specific)